MVEEDEYGLDCDEYEPEYMCRRCCAMMDDARLHCDQCRSEIEANAEQDYEEGD